MSQHRPVKHIVSKQTPLPQKEKKEIINNWYNPPDPPDCEEECDRHGKHKANVNCCSGPKGDRGENGAPGAPGATESTLVFANDVNTSDDFSNTQGVVLGAPGSVAQAVNTSSPPGSTTTSYLIPLSGLNATIAAYIFVVPNIGYIKNLEFCVNLDYTGSSTSGFPKSNITYNAYLFRSPALIANGSGYASPGFIVNPSLTTSVTFSTTIFSLPSTYYAANNFSAGPPLEVSRGDQIGIFVNSSSTSPINLNSVQAISMSATITYIPR